MGHARKHKLERRTANVPVAKVLTAKGWRVMRSRDIPQVLEQIVRRMVS
jgi:hypothetical protein